MVFQVSWQIYSPRTCRNGKTHYGIVHESHDEFDYILEATANFLFSKYYFDIKPGSFVRYSIWNEYESEEAEESEDSQDSQEEEGEISREEFCRNYSDFNGRGTVKFKWRLYRDYNCSDDDLEAFHCIPREESDIFFITYQECVQHFKVNSYYKKRFPKKQTTLRIECFEYDDQF